jgi:hypothetical protein
VEQQGEWYKAYQCSFQLSPDKKSLSGLWSFDGHDLPFELKPGALPVEPAPQAAAGRIAQPASQTDPQPNRLLS